MIEFDTTVRIGRTPGQVFCVLADFGTYLARWAKGPVAVVRTHGDGGDGSRYMIMARVGPARVRSPYEVTGYDPPGRSRRRRAGAFRGGVPPHRGRGGDDPQPVNPRYPRGPFRLAPGLLHRRLQKLIASDLGRLKDLLEAEIPPS